MIREPSDVTRRILDIHEYGQKPSKRIDIFLETSNFAHWIDRITEFISERQVIVPFGIERHLSEFEFFEGVVSDVTSLFWAGQLLPIELLVFGENWFIGFSAYPYEEYSNLLEYNVRLYGDARILSDGSEQASSAL